MLKLWKETAMLSLIKNQFNDVLAVQVADYDFESGSVKDIISLVREYGVVFWKRTNVSLDVYNKWQLKLGYHQYVDIWCVHEKYPIFMQVTNNYVRKGQKGLFEDQELDWHCNILFTPDSEELLGLYAKTVSKGAKTLFANSLPYWKNLNIKTCKEYSNLWLKITSKIENTYEKKLAHHSLPQYQLDDFEKKRRSRDIRKSINFENKHFNLYKEPRYLKQNYLKLVPKHPIGLVGGGGIYFPHLNVESITDLNGKTVPNHKEIYETIKKNYILSGRYVYQHEWEEGDIVLADQLTGVHKRNNIWKADPAVKRELLRSACWYKTDQRKHFDRVI